MIKEPRPTPTLHVKPRGTGRLASHPADKLHTLSLLGKLLRGLCFGGSAFLLGSCSLLLGAAPLGIALLAAASSYTWYILGGLLLSAALRPVALSGWAWAGVYILCVILRLVIRFFVDPPVLSDGRPCSGRLYLVLCWASFQKNVGLSAEPASAKGDTVTDYYEGAEVSSKPHRQAEGQPLSSAADKPSEAREGTASDFEPRLFYEHPFLRMLTAAVCGFLAGLFSIITGEFHVYDLLTGLCFLTVTPMAAFLLISCFGEAGMTLLFTPPASKGQAGRASSPEEPIEKRFHALPLLSVCFLLGVTVYAARGFRITPESLYLQIPPAILLGLVITFYTVSRWGAVSGITVAVICGLAADPRLSPLFILCAVGYIVLRLISHRAGVIGGSALGVSVGFAVDGAEYLIPRLPAVLLAIPVFLAVDTLQKKLPAEGYAGAEDKELGDVTALFSSALALEARSDTQRKRMAALSEAFESLSRRFYDLSDQLRRPRMLDLRRICDESFTKQCARCRNRDLCWGAEYDRTLEVQARLASQLHTVGKADARTLPDSLQDFCPHLEGMVEDINGRCARMTENLLRSEKTEIFAADYAAIAALLNDALEEDRQSADDFTCNREAADRVYEYLTEAGIRVQGVIVGGKRKKQRKRVIVSGTGFDSVTDLPALQARLEEICGFAMTPPVFEENTNGGGSTVMTLNSRAMLDVQYAGGTVSAGHKLSDPLPSPCTEASEDTPTAVCGDHIAMFRSDEAYFYALISDGMGSGEDASLTSDICAMFLEKMLAAGNRVEISLKMLDSYIRSKNTGTGNECSATVDLMELDLMDGHAVFAKNGAAPTYVVREGTVYKLHSPTLPIGILKDTPCRLLRFRTHPGDVVVMVSDGVTLGNDECPWLMDLLSGAMPESMDSLQSDIIKRALTAGSEDDLSAIAIRVEER